MSLKTQRRRSGAGTATGNTNDKIAQQTRNLSIAEDARFQVIPMKRVEGGDDQREAHPSQVGRLGHPLRLLPPPHPLNLKPMRRGKRSEKSEENKDDPERRGSLRMTRGTNAHPQLPPEGAGQTASHVANQGGPPRQRGKSVTQSILFKRTAFQTLSPG